ncbi:MAG: DUF362 domain-containing protein [Muribaculaceae bacterium]|nr:DUF362 domain-containing protein [Muribaculaceae bacterium]
MMLWAALLLGVSMTMSAQGRAPQCVQPLRPVGEGRGVFPGRVAWAHCPGAAMAGEYAADWAANRNVDQAACDEMMRSVVCLLGGSDDPSAAWDAIFTEFNKQNNDVDRPYSLGEKIAVKINCGNTNSHYNPTEINATPQMVLALVRSLVEDAGVPAECITIADPQNYIPDNVYEAVRNFYKKVGFCDRFGGNGRKKAEFDSYSLRYSNRAAGSLAKGIEQSFVKADYNINFALLTGCSGTGVALCGDNWLGCLNFGKNFSKKTNPNIVPNRNVEARYSALVDLMGHQDLGGKCLLYLIDGLYGSKTGSGKPGPKWRSEPFGGDWPCTLLASMDPVAVDIVGIDLLTNAFTDLPDAAYCDMYLREAATADKPASGTVYDPDRFGYRLNSLGVAEHWNNPTARLYSRNLNRGKGIELVYKKIDKKRDK